MYFRDKKGRKYSDPSLQLVDGIRTPKGVQQRIVISLGNMKIDESIRLQVAKRIQEILRGQQSLIPENDEIEKMAEQIALKIRMQGRWQQNQRTVRVTDAGEETAHVFINQTFDTDNRELGTVLVGLHAWEELGLPQILKRLGFSRTQIHSAAVSVINRLADPAAEHRLPAWLKSTALPDLLDEKLLNVAEDRFYRISDKLLEHQEAITNELAERERSLFNLSRTIVLYDLTNTYFEGVCANNPKAVHGGHSKEKRNDCPQLVVALILDGEGFVLGHRVYPGNTADSPTLLDMVQALRKRFPSDEKPTVIVDGGLSSEANLKTLRNAGFDYLVASRRQKRDSYEEVFAEAEFTPIQGRDPDAAVEVHARETENEMLVFCRSDSRKAKEDAIDKRATERFESDLGKLNKRLATGKLKDADKIQQSLGRLKERHHRVARHFEITVQLPQQDMPGQVAWERIKDPTTFHGGYILRCSRKNMTADEIWNTYITLTRAEAGFCRLKSDLGLRPIFHQNESRSDAHIWITVLAYHLLQYIQYTLRQKGDHRSWFTLKNILQGHRYSTIVMPTVEGTAINLRRAGSPEIEPKNIYDLLGVNYKQLPVKKIIA